jgi:hypothetical protein
MANCFGLHQPIKTFPSMYGTACCYLPHTSYIYIQPMHNITHYLTHSYVTAQAQLSMWTIIWFQFNETPACGTTYLTPTWQYVPTRKTKAKSNIFYGIFTDNMGAGACHRTGRGPLSLLLSVEFPWSSHPSLLLVDPSMTRVSVVQLARISLARAVSSIAAGAHLSSEWAGQPCTSSEQARAPLLTAPLSHIDG